MVRLLSVVVPTLNEAANLPRTVAAARAAARADQPFELVVSDCASRDGTSGVARALGATLASGGTCRAEALNRGAAAAAGDVLLFLHADSAVPAGFDVRIEQALRDADVVGGAFDFRWGPHPLNRGVNRAALGLVTFCNRVRFRYSRGFFGDQGIFVRRSVFDRLGGFPPMRLLEDLRFCQRMARLGRTAILSPPIDTSPRRFVARGVLRQFAQDLILLTCDSWGARPERMWAGYNRVNHEGKC